MRTAYFSPLAPWSLCLTPIIPAPGLPYGVNNMMNKERTMNSGPYVANCWSLVPPSSGSRSYPPGFQPLGDIISERDRFFMWWVSLSCIVYTLKAWEKKAWNPSQRRSLSSYRREAGLISTTEERDVVCNG